MIRHSHCNTIWNGIQIQTSSFCHEVIFFTTTGCVSAICQSLTLPILRQAQYKHCPWLARGLP